MSKKRKGEAYFAAKKAEKQARKKKKYITAGILTAVLVVLTVAALVLPDVYREAHLGEATHVVTMEIQDYGTVKLHLYGNDAPITVRHFVKLAKRGFYDGLGFHRIIDGFVMQGGGNAAVEVKSIKGEFAENGIKNKLPHDRGAISMARTNDKDSATSQFFIVHTDSAKNHKALDGKYACFGYVVEGMEVVDAAIAATAHTATDTNGSIPKEYRPIIKSLTVEKK